MRADSSIRARVVFFFVLMAAIGGGFDAASDAQEAAPMPVAQQPQTTSLLPPNPEDWVCHDTAPVTQKDIDAWCKSHPKGSRGLPLPDDLRNPPPIADFAAYTTYSENLKTFLSVPDQNMQFGYTKLGWISDAHWRLSGPSVVPANPMPSDFFHNYGPHFPLKVYYSPEMVDWLCSGRKGEIPDGAMMVKAMNVFSNLNISVNQDDGCMQIADPVQPNLWTPMIRSSKSSYDGWLWTIQQAPADPALKPPQFPPPLFGLSAFTVPIPDDPTTDDPSWYPTGGLQELGGFLPGFPVKKPDVVMLNTFAGFPYCMSCHGTAQKQSTFASMDNILGRELRYKAFEGPRVSIGLPLNFSLFPTPLATPSADFGTFFNQLAPVSFADAMSSRMPAESYDQQAVSAHGGAPQFITAAQCNGCHNATAQNPLLPNMVFVEDQPARSSRLRNLSPYGEWRVSPMGLAGRDPVFFSQLQSETNNLSALTPCIENTCLHCHAVMGQRQLAIDTIDRHDAACRDIFPIAPPPEVPFGTPLSRSALQQWPGSSPSDQQFYGALGRDGISCAVCHHISGKKLGREATATGNFITGKPDELYGPYKSGTVVTKPMEHTLGIKPRFGDQIASSEMCGSCHDILLPVFDNSGHLISAGYEQATHLEWLNSESGRPGRNFRSCQDCHMPTQYKGNDLPFKIANNENPDNFPPTTNRLADKDLRLTERNRYSRHSLHGLNGFLNQFFQQFPLLLGFQQVDWMSEQPSFLDPPAPPFLSNFLMELPLFTGFESILDMAENQTATLQIGPVSKTTDGALLSTVKVTNLTGHDLPTGVGFRRMFLQFLVLDNQGNTLWASGRTNDLGFILDGLTDNVLQSEQPLSFPSAAIQPHYQIIDSGSEVQIYQELIRDSDQALTTSFLKRVNIVKDNRIRPRGFNPQLFARSSSQYIRDLAKLTPEEAADPYYTDPKLTGADVVEYKIPLDPDTLSRADHVQVTLYYQSIPPFYLQDRFHDATQGAALQDDIKRLYYITSHLNLDDAKSESGAAVLQGWKLQLSQQVGVAQ